MGLRIRSAGTAPGVGDEELFGTGPASLILDRDLSDGAARLYVILRLIQIEDKTPKYCFATKRELARLLGVTEREIRYRVVELETRGHVVRERVRTSPGSPVGIRPLARLKTASGRSSTRNNDSGCTRNNGSAQPERQGHAPGTDIPPNRNGRSIPLKTERDKEDPEEVAGSIGVRDEPARPTSARKEDGPPPPPLQNYNPPIHFDPIPPEEAKASRDALQELRDRARKSRESRTGKSTPAAETRDSVPDAKDCTGEPTELSRPDSAKGNITPKI